jgi:hypothetical protein
MNYLIEAENRINTAIGKKSSVKPKLDKGTRQNLELLMNIQGIVVDLKMNNLIPSKMKFEKRKQGPWTKTGTHFAKNIIVNEEVLIVDNG